MSSLIMITALRGVLPRYRSETARTADLRTRVVWAGAIALGEHRGRTESGNRVIS